MRAAALLLTLAFSVAGCQCLTTVEEDGGLGPDGGAVSLDAGPRLACRTPADCSGQLTPVFWCQDAGFSCVDAQCVSECDTLAGATCAVDQATECLTCPPAATCTRPFCATGPTGRRWFVEEVRCRIPSPLAAGDQLLEEPTDSPLCGRSLWKVADAGLLRLGTLYSQAATSATDLANLPPLGGHCRVADLPTGAPRAVLDCPWCQVTVMGR